ncbi:MAG: peptidoglycan editing factor PgeF [Pseudomonadales bacterium]
MDRLLEAKLSEHCVVPNWVVPDNILAFTSTRQGGFSEGAFESWNIANHVSDIPETVAQNRRKLASLMPPNTELNWLQQVHGSLVHQAPTLLCEGDGLYTAKVLQACCIMTADCVPILLCDKSGSEIGALHAGWRGVANRIIEHGVGRFDAANSDIHVWIGPSISVRHFRIGRDVYKQLRQSIFRVDSEHCFTADKQSSEHFFADLGGLIELQCRELGIDKVSHANRCSYAENECFYSYRRDGETGRNASVIVRLA